MRGRKPLRWEGREWLSEEAERALLRLIQNGSTDQRDRAFASLVREFRPLLDSAVDRAATYEAEKDDLSQVARLAMLRAADRFDLTRDERFASYASPWVEGAIRRYRATDAAVRLPEGRSRQLARVESVAATLHAELGRQPTDGEIADRTDLKVSLVRELRMTPRVRWSLAEIENGEAQVLQNRNRPGGWARAVAAQPDVCGDGDLGASPDEYSVGEVEALIVEYQSLRSQVELRPSPLGEPRLRRGDPLPALIRLIDLDLALQRIPSTPQFAVTEIVGLRQATFRQAGSLLTLPHTTLKSRSNAAVRWLTKQMNRNQDSAPVRRHVFWRRLFAWNLGELWLHGEPLAFEVWARLGQAGELYTGKLSIPVAAMAVFGDGWLLTPEAVGRSDWDDWDD